MVFTYDVATDAGRVRLLIGDTVDSGHLFEDVEIDAFLAMNDADVLLGAAQALDVMAASQAMVLKVITMNGVTTNGAAVATALRAQAASYRQQAEAGAAGVDADDATWDYAETVGTADAFAWRERVLNQALRGVV